jgi:hypothetical protein
MCSTIGAKVPAYNVQAAVDSEHARSWPSRSRPRNLLHKVCLPGDSRESPRGGIRIDVQELTRQGMRERWQKSHYLLDERHPDAICQNAFVPRARNSSLLPACGLQFG